MHTLSGRNAGAVQSFFEREYSDGDAQKILSAFESSYSEHDPRLDEGRLRFPAKYFVLHTQTDLQSAAFGTMKAGWHTLEAKANESTIATALSK